VSSDLLEISETGRREFNVVTVSTNLTYAWAIDGVHAPGETYSKFIFRANYSSAGTHNISVAVMYGGTTVSHHWTLVVSNVDRPPAAGIGAPAPRSRWRTGEPVTFNASASSDPDMDDALRFSWDLGDGTRTEGPEAFHTYRKAGTYRVTLTVSDGSQAANASLTITVDAPARSIGTGGPGAGPYLAAGAAVALAAAAGGAVVLARRRRAAGKAAAEAPSTPLLARLPAPADLEAEEALRPRATSPEEWRTIERQAAASLAAPAVPPPAPAARPASRPEAPVAPPGAAVSEGVAFEEIPEAEVILEMEAIPEARPELVPPASPAPARSASLEELLALLGKK